MNLVGRSNSTHWNYRLILLALVLSGCGLIGTGGSVNSNDSEPSGTIIYSGSFATNSNGISGQTYVYVSSGTYIVRLESFSSSGVSGLRVLGKTADGETPLNSALKGTSGNQNYSVGSTSSGVWTRIQIQNASIAPPDDIYATAILTEVNP